MDKSTTLQTHNDQGAESYIICHPNENSKVNVDFWVELEKARPSKVQLEQLNQADIEAKEQLQLHQSVQRRVFLYEVTPMDSSKWQRKQSSSGAKQGRQSICEIVFHLTSFDNQLSHVTKSVCIQHVQHVNYNWGKMCVL